MQLKALGFAGVAAAAHAASAMAHHSFANFDADREVAIQGVVRDFQWTNPHAWIILAVENAGRVERWAIELSPPGSLVRQGWEPKTLIPGMPVTVTVHPLRDGTNGGQFLEIILRDGTVMRRSGAPAQ